MAQLMKQVVAILPDGTEYFTELRTWDARGRFNYEEAAREAVRKQGLSTPRANPRKVPVTVCDLSIKDGKIVRAPGETFHVLPSMERMTESEYDTELAALLNEVPEAFHPFVREKAYDDGHSAGYEEVVLLAGNIICGLKPCIEAYRKELKG